MEHPFSLLTNRLVIEPLTASDDNFIFELVNTEGWLQFIGNRNIASVDKANEYIQNILAKENIAYWVIKLKTDKNKIGLITFIKREYLKHSDLGFAFLPQFCNKGYACEAAGAVLHQLFRQHKFLHILATTLPNNLKSIHLLEKIGFVFAKEMEMETAKILVYIVSEDGLSKSQHINSN